jgi:hypothetical protein
MSTFWRCAYRSTALGGVQFVNTFAVKCDPEGGELEEADAGEVSDAVASWLNTKYRAMLVADYTVQDLTVRSLTGSPTESSETIAAAGTLTGGSGAPLPREVGLLLATKTSLASRRGRGRMWIPGPLLAGYLSGEHQWSTGGNYYGACATFAAELLDGHDFNGGTSGLQGFHLSYGIWSRLDEVFRDAVSCTPRGVPHWLSSRSTAP